MVGISTNGNIVKVVFAEKRVLFNGRTFIAVNSFPNELIYSQAFVYFSFKLAFNFVRKGGIAGTIVTCRAIKKYFYDLFLFLVAILFNVLTSCWNLAKLEHRLRHQNNKDLMKLIWYKISGINIL